MARENDLVQGREGTTGTAGPPDDLHIIDLTVFDRPGPSRTAGPDPSWRVAYEPGGAVPTKPASALRWMLAVVVLGAAVMVCAALAWLHYDRAIQWRDHARERDAQYAAMRAEMDDARAVVTQAEGAIATAEQRVLAAERDASAVQEQLSTAEAEVARLESRISALANEKAQAEDERWLAGVARDRLSGAQVRVDVVGNDLDSCVQTLRRWLDQRPVQTADALTWDAWSAEGDGIAASCTAVASDFGQLSNLLR